MNIRAKMRCETVDSQDWGENVVLRAVYSEDKNSENYTYSQATPNASIQMTISNPSARGQFKQSEEYYIDFRPVRESS